MVWRKVLRRKFAKRRRGALTIMAVPTTDGSVRSISMPLLFVYLGSSVAIAVVAFLVLSYLGMTATVTRFYHQQVVKDAHIQELTKHNQELQGLNEANSKRLQEFAQRTAELEKELDRLDAASEEILGIIKGKKTSTSGTAMASRGSYERGTLPGSERDGPAILATAEGEASLAAATETRMSALEEAIAALDGDFSALRRSAISYRDRLDHTPSGWPLKGRITSSFGRRQHPITRRVQLHDGADIAGPVGAAVKATADGVVSFSGTRAGYGRVVVIGHGYGFETVYAHNSRNLVSAGQRVKRGQVIAHLGSSGTTTGPHVHYEVRVSGRPANPMSYMR